MGYWKEETNQFGGTSRYYFDGDSKEEEMKVNIGGVWVPQSQVAAHNARIKAEKERCAKEEAAKPATIKSCPFRTGANTLCRDNCMLRTVHGCSIVFMVDRAPQPAQAAGKTCPFNPYMCTGEKCEFWRGGCVLTAI